MNITIKVTFLWCLLINRQALHLFQYPLHLHEKNQEIWLEDRNGLHHFIWEASENMGCDFEAMKNFYSLKPVDLDILCSGLFFHHINKYSFMFVHKISTWVVCVNSKYLVSHYWTGINFLIWFEFQDGVRFYIYFDSDYELDADSVEEKNKVSILGLHFTSTIPVVHMICQFKNHQVILLVRQTRKVVGCTL